MTDFKMTEVALEAVELPTDTRSHIERMFFDFNQDANKKTPLNVIPLASGDDWKRVQDCIPLIREFRKDDADYEGPLKNKDVLVFGGRRRGRAGTGVELLLAVDDVEEFCSLVQEVAKVVRK